MRLKSPVVPGHLHRVAPLEVPGLGHRALTLYLPPGYHSSPEKRYPVAYMFDGQNLFGDEGSFAGGWHLHKTLDRLQSARRTVPIVIGIHHGGTARIDELSPWRVPGGGGGRAGDLLHWVTGTLAGYVARDLRVLPGPANTLVGGSSMGGLMALYALSSRPDFFGNALCMSPSLWVGGGAIFRHIQSTPLPPHCRVYIDAGRREGAMMQHAVAMSRLLSGKGLRPGTHLMWRPDSRGSHNERAWRRRLPKAMRFLLGRRV